MKMYSNFQDIENDLKRLRLERDIAWEELKLMKSEYKEDLKPMNWVGTALKLTGKYGLIALIRRLIFKR